MTEDQVVDERAFSRLAGIARATRQDWATRGLTGPQTSPYEWPTLAEIVGLRELRRGLDGSDLDTVWRQVRASVASWRSSDPATVLLDLHTLRATWAPDAARAFTELRAGTAMQLVSLEGALHVAWEGFALGAAAFQRRAQPRDEVAQRRRRRRGAS